MKGKCAEADDCTYVGTQYCFYREGFKDRGIQVVGERSPEAIMRFDPSRRWAHWESRSDAGFFESSPANLPLIEIQRTNLLPFLRYVIHRDGVQSVVVTCKSVFRTRWNIFFSNGIEWQFHKPLYTAFFHARCGDSITVRIRTVAEGRRCYALFSPGQDSPESIGAIACVMRHHWIWDGF
jgi:hypothetical protein